MASDWKCKKCGGINPEKRTSCLGCNSPKEGDPKEIRQEYISKINNLKNNRDELGLISLLHNSESYVRAFSAEALGKIKSVTSIESIIGLLHDPDDFVRMNAAEALGNIGDKKAVNSLLSLLKSTDIVRNWAIIALGKIRDESTLLPIMELLDDNTPSIRKDAASALGEFRNNNSVPKLITALKDSDIDVRHSAALSLGKINDISASSALVDALQNADPLSKSIYNRALGQLGKTCKHQLDSKCKCKLCNQTLHIIETKSCFCKRCGEAINHELVICKCNKCGVMIHDWDYSGVFNGYFYHCRRCRSYMHSQTGSITEIS